MCFVHGEALCGWNPMGLWMSNLSQGNILASEQTMTEKKERAVFWWCMIVFLLGFWVLIATLVT
jgi:hypothetical protein